MYKKRMEKSGEVSKVIRIKLTYNSREYPLSTFFTKKHCKCVIDPIFSYYVDFPLRPLLGGEMETNGLHQGTPTTTYPCFTQ